MDVKIGTGVFGKDEFWRITSDITNDVVVYPKNKYSKAAALKQYKKTMKKISLPKGRFRIEVIPFHKNSGYKPEIVELTPNAKEFHTGYWATYITHNNKNKPKITTKDYVNNETVLRELKSGGYKIGKQKVEDDIFSGSRVKKIVRDGITTYIAIHFNQKALTSHLAKIKKRGGTAKTEKVAGGTKVTYSF